jgi:hypothetical protein
LENLSNWCAALIWKIDYDQYFWTTLEA